MSLLFKNYSLVELMYLLIRFNKNKSFLWNTNNTDRTGANEQNAQHTQREIKLLKELVSVSDTPFYRAPPSPFYQPTPLFLWENSELQFLVKFWKFKHPFYKWWGSNYDSVGQNFWLCCNLVRYFVSLSDILHQRIKTLFTQYLTCICV